MRVSSLKESRIDQGSALLGLMILGIAAALPTDSPLWIHAVLIVLGVSSTCLSITLGAGHGAPVALVATLLVLALGIHVLWQAAMSLALLAWWFASRSFPLLRASGWQILGGVPWLTTILCALVTPIALVTWVRLMHPDLSDLLSQIPQVAWPVLLAGAVLFIFVNAIGEELIWRGLFIDRLGSMFGPLTAIMIQGVSFGAQHAQGVPRGLVGMGMAGIWGIMLGWLRRSSGGMLAPIFAHLVADATVAVIVLVLAGRL